MFATLARTPFALTRATVRRVAAGLAGVLLCAQMAIAAYACPGLALVTAADAEAATASAAPAVSAPMANCDGMNGATGSALDPAAPNLCAEHCKYGQQSDQAGTLSVQAAVLTALYAVQPVPVASPAPRPAAATLCALVAASPPHAIAHCVYRI
jgi:hypothetical protein